jgi:hypothetical protein
MAAVIAGIATMKTRDHLIALIDLLGVMDITSFPA